MPEEIDIQKATSMAKTYFVNTYGPIAEFSFRVISVFPNSKENVWKVSCEAYATPKDNSPTRYLVRVDVATGKLLDVQPSTQP